MTTKYDNYFFEGRRATSEVGKKVKVVKDELLDNFLKEVVSDKDIDVIFRLLFGTLYSGGCRVSEALNIKKEDIRKDGNYYVAKVKVLKKKTEGFELTRDIVFHPTLNGLLEEILSKRKPNEYVFKYYTRITGQKRLKSIRITRNYSYRILKRHFGLDNHSLRHSNISLLMSKGLTDIQIAKQLELSIKMVSNYAHVNQAKTMKNIFSV
jgi:integrase